MTDLEYSVLDELYFLQSYSYLANTLELSDDVLKTTLMGLLKKGWIRCYSSPTDELGAENLDIGSEYWNYHYLATKAGLLAHNSNS